MIHPVDDDPPVDSRNIHDDTPNSADTNVITINTNKSNENFNLLEKVTDPFQYKNKSNLNSIDIVLLKIQKLQVAPIIFTMVINLQAKEFLN